MRTEEFRTSAETMELLVMDTFHFNKPLFRTALRSGLPAGAAVLACLLYLALLPGDSLEPGAQWKIPLSLLLYAGAFFAALQLKRRPARLIYFAFPFVLFLEEALNFAPIDQYYGSGQLPFALLLAVWCWCCDTALGETLAVKFRSLAWLPTLLIGGILYLLPLTILAHHIASGRKFTYDSIQAVYQTDTAEAIHYLFTDPTCLVLLAAVVAAAALLWFLNRFGTPAPAPRAFRAGCALLALALLPWVWLELAGREALNRTKVLFTDSLGYFDVIESYAAGYEERLAEVARRVEKSSGDDGIYVLILGEAHSRRHSSAYGYSPDTTPFLRQAADSPDCILMRNACSCHVQTMQVLTMLLTARNQYDTREQAVWPSLFDVANYCAYETTFLSNQYPHGRFDSPVTALASEAKNSQWLNTMEDFLLWRARPDGALLEKLPAALQSQRGLVVLHLMGSHGPYFKRYPEEFGRDLEMVPYDKSIRYTDFLLEQMVEMFRRNPKVRAALYLSDHSEIPGIGHAADLFEPEMAEIPMMLYLSDTLRRERPQLEHALRNNAAKLFTNDLVFELMLDLMGIRHTFGAPELRFASPEYDLPPEKARTLWGTRPLTAPAQ